VTDIIGSILAVNIHAANKHDTKGGVFVFEKALYLYQSIQAVCGDEVYRGKFKNTFEDFHNIRIISPKIKPVDGISPKRWRVERTFAWLVNYRRLSKDYEIRASTEENMVIISHFHTLLMRICVYADGFS